MRLEDFLSDILGKKVDLVMKDAVKPRMKKRILESVEPVQKLMHKRDTLEKELML